MAAEGRGRAAPRGAGRPGSGPPGAPCRGFGGPRGGGGCGCSSGSGWFGRVRGGPGDPLALPLPRRLPRPGPTGLRAAPHRRQEGGLTGGGGRGAAGPPSAGARAASPRGGGLSSRGPLAARRKCQRRAPRCVAAAAGGLSSAGARPTGGLGPRGGRCGQGSAVLGSPSAAPGRGGGAAGRGGGASDGRHGGRWRPGGGTVRNARRRCRGVHLRGGAGASLCLGVSGAMRRACKEGGGGWDGRGGRAGGASRERTRSASLWPDRDREV